jgi:hypothetical protein
MPPNKVEAADGKDIAFITPATCKKIAARIKQAAKWHVKRFPGRSDRWGA